MIPKTQAEIEKQESKLLFDTRNQPNLKKRESKRAPYVKKRSPLLKQASDTTIIYLKNQQLVLQTHLFFQFAPSVHTLGIQSTVHLEEQVPVCS